MPSMKSPLPKQWIWQKLQPATRNCRTKLLHPGKAPKGYMSRGGKRSDKSWPNGFNDLTTSIAPFGTDGEIIVAGRQSASLGSTRKAIADRVVAAGRQRATGSFGYPTRAPLPFVGSGGSTMWSLNPYRFGKLNGTSIQPHGVRTHPPSADSGRRGRRSLSGGRRLVGRSSRREPGLRSGASSDSRSRSRECSESLTGRPRPLSAVGTQAMLASPLRCGPARRRPSGRLPGVRSLRAGWGTACHADASASLRRRLPG